MRIRFASLIATAAIAAVSTQQPLSAQSYPQPLTEEPTPAIAWLPERYPDNWMLVHDFNFNSIPDGRVAIIDIAAENRNLKGVVSAAQFGNVLNSTTKSEIYTAETYYTRLSRGERTDVITVWDKVSLKPKGEIVLPGGKRGQFVTIKNSFQFTNAEKWALVFNFTPGSSVTVVDLEGRKVLGDVDLPGCAMVYPSGERGFSTLCTDGTVTSITLDAAGKIASASTSKKINDIDADAMFMMPAMVGKTAWFLTFKGNLRGVDLAGPVARDLGGFSVGSAGGGTPEWRPSGWQTITADAAGLLYVLMSPNGKEGSHKDGGSEVWVIDPVKKSRVQRIMLATPGVSIEVSRQAKPLLVVARADAVLDVYDAEGGQLVRSLGGAITFNPLTMTAGR